MADGGCRPCSMAKWLKPAGALGCERSVPAIGGARGRPGGAARSTALPWRCGLRSMGDKPPWPALPPQPLVTIVTPSLNQRQFIEATIRSVLDQDYPTIEYLVMDGGSTDGTLDILRRYEDRLTWVSMPDGGQAEAINRGWRRGRGEVLAWLNSDDIYLPGAVSAAVACLRAHPQVAGVYGDCDYIDEHGRTIDTHPTTPFDYATMLQTARAPIPQPATFLRQVAVESVNYLDARLTMLLDFDLWIRLG